MILKRLKQPQTVTFTLSAVDSEIMIENVSPMAPYNLTANSSSTAITLRWVPGYIRSYLSYYVWYRSVIAQEWRATKAE